jgi:hypothetical protein
MTDRKARLALTVVAVALPGPWTPVIVLAYLLGRAADRDRTAKHGTTTAAPPYPQPPGPYARLSVTASSPR